MFHPAHHLVKPKRYFSPIIVFSWLMFFIGLGDAIMSYVSPVYMEEFVGNTLYMGFILSSSSVAGLLIDFFISEHLWNKSHVFFTKATIMTAIFFPLAFLIGPPSVSVFVLGMLLWGAYYEFRGFSMFNFIHSYLEKDQHTQGWEILNSYKAAAYFFGSVFAAYILAKGYHITFIGALLAFAASAIIFFIQGERKTFVKFSHKHVKTTKRSPTAEVRILGALMNKVWPLFIFTFLIFVVDACFWTVGTLLAQDLQKESVLGGLLVASYLLPPVFSRILTPKVHADIGKKRTAFTFALISAVFLVAMGTTNNIPLLLIYVFLMSAFLNASLILQSAVIEDYVARLKEFGNDMVGVQQMAESFGYIIGPILTGTLAFYFGHSHTFTVVGILLGAVALMCFFVVPRKVRLPEKELKRIEESVSA